MSISHIHGSFLVTGFWLLISACAGPVPELATIPVPDGRYDSEFPSQSSSTQLEAISQSLKMINSIGFYKSYLFPEGSRVSKQGLTHNQISSNALKVENHNHSTSGTATVIYSEGRKVALLTCAHIIDYPDTIFTYFEPDRIYLRSLSFKERQIHYITGLPEGSDLEILFLDRDLDIALVGKEFYSPPAIPINVFNYPIGKARELQWGSFVYLLGFPVGNKMVTQGIVSNPRQDKHHSFLTDAPFNRGSSGGIVLAVRDGVPNFELVGIANSVAAQFEYVLRPVEDLQITPYQPKMQYDGPVFIDRKENIRYGITHIIGIEAVISALEQNRAKLLQKGYNIKNLSK